MYLKFTREPTIVGRLSSPICCVALFKIDNAVLIVPIFATL